MKKIVGEKHKNSIPICREIALAYFHERQDRKVEEYYKKAIEIYKKLGEPTGTVIYIIYYDVVALYRRSGNFEKAIEFYNLAIEKYEDITGGYALEEIKNSLVSLQKAVQP